MDVDPKLYNKAFKIFQEFGPRRAVPAENRIKEEFPQLSVESIHQLIESYKSIESFAYDIAEQIRDKEMKKDEGIKLIGKHYPLLDKARISKTFNQAMYFSLK